MSRLAALASQGESLGYWHVLRPAGDASVHIPFCGRTICKSMSGLGGSHLMALNTRPRELTTGKGCRGAIRDVRVLGFKSLLNSVFHSVS